MDTIVVPKWTESMGISYSAFIEEWRRRVGAPNALGIYGGQELAWRDDALYSRSLDHTDEEFFTLQSIENPQDVPEVLCPCGSVAFTLRYGHWQLNARCTECGKECEVYGG